MGSLANPANFFWGDFLEYFYLHIRKLFEIHEYMDLQIEEDLPFNRSEFGGAVRKAIVEATKDLK